MTVETEASALSIKCASPRAVDTAGGSLVPEA